MKTRSIYAAFIGVFFLSAATMSHAAVAITYNDSYLYVESELIGPLGIPYDMDEDYFFATAIPSSFGNSLSSYVSLPTNPPQESLSSADAYMDVFIDTFPDVPLSITMDMSAMASSEIYHPDYEAYSYAESVFDITFTTDEFYDFSFGAEFIDAYRNAWAYIGLSDSAGNFFIDLFVENETIFPYDIFEAAAPDEYHLVVALSADSFLDVQGLDDSGTSALAFFEVTPSAVPVPSALWLLGSGLLALCGLTRKK